MKLEDEDLHESGTTWEGIDWLKTMGLLVVVLALMGLGSWVYTLIG